MSERWRVASLDAVESLPGPGTLRWLPIRHELGSSAFGTNAYVARAAGDDVVEPQPERARELGGDEVRDHAATDPDLERLR